MLGLNVMREEAESSAVKRRGHIMCNRMHLDEQNEPKAVQQPHNKL